MTADEFMAVLDNRIKQIQNTLGKKANEYSRGGDRLSNFKTAARRLNSTPERALLGMKEKHSVSIGDMINDLDADVLPTLELVNEKIGDEINYLILLEALITERIKLIENNT